VRRGVGRAAKGKRCEFDESDKREKEEGAERETSYVGDGRKRKSAAPGRGQGTRQRRTFSLNHLLAIFLFVSLLLVSWQRTRRPVGRWMREQALEVVFVA
jgi:hypothetical protein